MDSLKAERHEVAGTPSRGEAEMSPGTDEACAAMSVVGKPSEAVPVDLARKLALAGNRRCYTEKEVGSGKGDTALVTGTIAEG